MRRSRLRAWAAAAAMAVVLAGSPPAQADEAEISAADRQQMLLDVAEHLELRYADVALGAALADSIRTYVDQGQADSPTDAPQRRPAVRPDTPMPRRVPPAMTLA